MSFVYASSALESVSSLLRQRLVEYYPALSTVTTPEWRPQPIVERGELWSDWCLDLAKIQRQDPRELARIVVNGLELPEGVALNAAEGYLTLSCESLPFSSAPPTRTGQRTVIVAPVSNGANRWLVMRTVAAAAVQLQLSSALGERVEIRLGDEVLRYCEGRASETLVREMLSWAWTTEERSPAETRDALVSLCEDVQSGTIQPGCAESSSNEASLWLLPTTLPQSLFTQFYRQSLSNQRQIALCCPSGGWFIDPPQHRMDDRVLSAEEQRLWALALHLAGGQSARDIDQYAGWFSEFDSLPWSANAALQRLQRSYAEAESGLYRVSPCGSRSALLYDAVHHDAVVYGTVPFYVGTVQALARDSHHLASYPPQVISSDDLSSGPEGDDFGRLLVSVCRRFLGVFG